MKLYVASWGCIVLANICGASGQYFGLFLWSAFAAVILALFVIQEMKP